jgi:hypothetical protein
MNRTCLLFLVGVLATCAAGAPAPKEQPWVTGWQTGDKDKHCKFVRKGDVLTIELSGKSGVTENSLPLSKTPRLLRDVRGDFVIEVRLSGNFEPVELPKEEGNNPSVVAGLVLMGEKQTFLRIQRTTFRLPESAVTKFCLPERTATRVEVDFFRDDESLKSYDYGLICPVEKVFRFRLRRSGDKFFAAFQEDGKQWRVQEAVTWRLPGKLKLGVFAASESEGRFAPRFDKLKLDLKGPKGQ